jgi:hypothetical protein
MAVLLVGMPPSAGHAAARPTRSAMQVGDPVTSWDVTGELHTDGSVAVTEVITTRVLATSASPSVGTRTFDPSSQVAELDGADGAGTLAVDPPTPDHPTTWTWHLRAAAHAGDTTTVTLTYVLGHAATAGRDVGALDWPTLTGDHPRIEHLRVAVRLPSAAPAATSDTPDSDVNVLRGFLHAPGVSAELQLSGLGVLATGDRVDPGSSFGLRVVAPATMFTNIGPIDLLPGILASEAQRATTTTSPTVTSSRPRWPFVLLAVLAVAMMVEVLRRRRRSARAAR